MSTTRHHDVSPFDPARPGALVGTIVDVLDLLGQVGSEGSDDDDAGTPEPCALCRGGAGKIDPRLMLATELSLRDGAVLLWAGTDCRPVRVIRELARRHGIDPGVPLAAQDPAFAAVLLHGWPGVPVESVHRGVRKVDVYTGCVDDLGFLQRRGTTARGNVRAIRYFTSPVGCPGCRGTRRHHDTGSILGAPLSDVVRRPVAALAADVERRLTAAPRPGVRLAAAGVRLRYLRDLGLRSLFAVA